MRRAVGRSPPADVAAQLSSCRRFHDQRWTDTPSERKTRPARTRDAPVRLRIVERVFTGQAPVRIDRSRHLRGDRDGSAAARRRGRRGHGRRDRARRRRSGGDSAAAAAGQNIGRRGADISPGDRRRSTRGSAEPEPRRRRRGDRLRRSSKFSRARGSRSCRPATR